MPASAEQIQSAIRGFSSLIESDSMSNETRIERLQRSLDELAYLQHHVAFRDDGREYPDPPGKEYEAVRKIVGKQFPDFGFYNVPVFVAHEIEQTSIMVGDAIDDITDIADELYEVEWRFENTSRDNALWYFAFSYLTHWQTHLRDLQWYLCHREEEQAKP